MRVARARTWRTGSPHESRLGYTPCLISCGLVQLILGAWVDVPTIPTTTKRSYHHLAILKHHHHNNEYTMLIIIIIIIIPKLQFLLHIQKKDIFLLSNPADKAFSTTNYPRFYSSAIHLSPIILVFWGLLGVVSYSVTESQLSNKRLPFCLSPLPTGF